jgi:hypothetical protein
MVHKKDLTALSKRGRIEKHAGKGGLEQRLRGGERSTVAGPDDLPRMLNAYPKAPVAPAPPTSSPPLGGPALGSPVPPVDPLV